MKSKYGFSVLEVIVAIGVGIIVVLGIVSSMQIGNKLISRSNQYASLYSIESEVRQSLNNEKTCTANLNTTRLSTINLDTSSISTPTYAINVNNLADSLGRIIVDKINYGQLQVVDLKLMDFKQIDLDKTYLANFTIFTVLDGIEKKIKVPVFFETTGTSPSLTLVRCGASYDSQITVINEQVCTALSGTYNPATQKCTGVASLACPTPGDVVRGISSTGVLDCFTPPPPITVSGCSVGNVVTSSSPTAVTCGAPPPPVTIAGCSIGTVVTSSSPTAVTCGPASPTVTVTNCTVGNVVISSTGTNVECGPAPAPVPTSPGPATLCKSKYTSCSFNCAVAPGTATFEAKCDSLGNPSSRVYVTGTLFSNPDSGWVAGFEATVMARCHSKGDSQFKAYWTSPTSMGGQSLFGTCSASFP